MQIFINGQPHTVPADATLTNLLVELGVQPRQVAVEVNLELVPRQKHSDHRLQEGDRLEVVTLVGGG
jgi:thiamine biosynthesis protein ThiS